MMNSTYKVLTPAGQFDAVFAEDEDTQIEYAGDEVAIQFFKNWLLLNQISGEHGHLLDSGNLTPGDLYGFCQSSESGIEVMPPFEDLLAYTQEDTTDQVKNADEKTQEGDYMEVSMVNDDVALDGAYTDADKSAISATLQLFKAFKNFIESEYESARIPAGMPNINGTSRMNKEEAKKLLGYLLDVAINRKAGIPDMTSDQVKRLSDYRWDARVIYDYMTNRVRSTGSRNLLRTPEMKKKFPEIDNQPREELDSVDCDQEIVIVLNDDEALLLDSAHWVTTKTGSHLLIEGGEVVGGAGGKLNGTKVMTKRMAKDKEDDDKFISREYNKEHDFGARLHGGPNGKKSADDHAERLTRILGRKFTTQKEGTHVFYGFDNKRYDLHRAVPQDKVALDSATGIEKIGLVKELSGIRSNLKTAQSGVEKLKMVKRINEIRVSLGIGGGELDKNGFDADGMWPMTRAEYKKIHKDYKGTFPDGTPSAMKLVDGATTLVAVRITDEKPKKTKKTDVKTNATTEDVNNVMPLLKRFIGGAQLSAISSAMRGEEGQFFRDKLIEVANVIQTMPKTYGQDGMGDDAIAYLHYFKGAGDWHITEKDMEDEQLQAFGLADLFGDGGELGYISIEELIGAGVELDLYWTPKTLKIIKGGGD